MTTYRLMDGASGRPGNGPASVTSFSGNYTAGVVFQATAPGTWFEGYWWWVCPTGGQVTAQKFALWQVRGSAAGTVVDGSQATSGTLSAGWNYVPLAAPLLLSQGIAYEAATGFTAAGGSGFPLTANQFGSGDPYAAGITNGPLQAYSSLTGSGEVPNGWLPQMPFGTPASPDPGVSMPVANDHDDNLWIDVQVSDVAPAGATYRTFPSYPTPLGQNVPTTSTDYTLGRQFSLSSACTLEKVWHYSPPTATLLPTRCAIWDVTSQTVVSGTDNASPSWLLPSGSAASAGGGWVYCDYSGAGVTLNASQNYKVARFNANASAGWFAVTLNFWTTGPGASGLTQGPLSSPADGSASPGQDSFLQSATWGYPLTGASGEISWGDVEVLPASAPVTGTGTAALSLAVSAPGSAARAGSAHAAVALGASSSGAPAKGGSGSAAVSLGASSSGASSRAGSAAAVLALRALASGTSHRSGTGVAHVGLAALGVAPAPALAVPAQTGSWWGLYNVLQERAEYAAYYRSQPPVACPNDGTPLKNGPPESPEVELYCPFDGFAYPGDYDPDIHSGM